MELTDAARGYEDGYRLGWEHGYRLGRSKAAAEIPASSRGKRNLKVIYVESGLWAYRPMDDGIAAALAESAAEVRTIEPSGAVVDLAEAFRPDLVLALNSVECMPASTAIGLREKGFRTAVWFTDDPYYTDVTLNLAPHYDYVFTLESACVPLYQELGCAQVYHLPFAANTGLYRPKAVETSKRTDICFIGSAFRNRIELFDELAPYLKDKRVLISGYWWDRLRHFDLLREKIITGYWLSPEETCGYYNGAKIVINLHRAIDDESNRNSRMVPARSVNPRTFEINASGGFQLCDFREELSSVYAPGAELDTFSSPAELMEKLDYWLAHPAEREQAALAGIRRTMREHTYRNRISRMLDIVFGEQ